MIMSLGTAVESFSDGQMGILPHNERTGKATRDPVTDCLIQPLDFQKNKLRSREGKELVEVAQQVRGRARARTVS